MPVYKIFPCLKIPVFSNFFWAYSTFVKYRIHQKSNIWTYKEASRYYTLVELIQTSYTRFSFHYFYIVYPIFLKLYNWKDHFSLALQLKTWVFSSITIKKISLMIPDTLFQIHSSISRHCTKICVRSCGLKSNPCQHTIRSESICIATSWGGNRFLLSLLYLIHLKTLMIGVHLIYHTLVPNERLYDIFS